MMDGRARRLETVSGRERSLLRTEAGRVACGNPACSMRWISFLKDRRRPIFEGAWGCSSSCLQAIVSAALRREEVGSGAPDWDGAYQHRMPLGLVLLAQGWITQDQLHYALERRLESGQVPIGQLLVEECGLQPQRVARALGIQWGRPVLTLEGFEPRRMARVVPRVLLKASGMVPLRVASTGKLYLGFAKHVDDAAAFVVGRVNGFSVETGLLQEAHVREAQRQLAETDGVETRIEQVADRHSVTGKMVRVLAKWKPKASRLVRWRQSYWLRMWLEAGSMSSGAGTLPGSAQEVLDFVYQVGHEQ